MPAGMSWPRYILCATVSLITTLTGAQIVHLYYKPLDDLEDLIQQELERRRKCEENKNV